MAKAYFYEYDRYSREQKAGRRILYSYLFSKQNLIMLVSFLSKDEPKIELKDYLEELKKQIFFSEKSKKKGMMRVRSLEVELETVIESRGEGGLSVYVIHGEKEKITQTRNKIKINLVSPDIIQMESAKHELEIVKTMLPYLEKAIHVRG